MTQPIVDTSSGRVPMRTHWMPRFVGSGVMYEDLQDLLGRIDSWEVWCKEWSDKGAMHEELAARALAAGRLVTAGEAFHLAALCYHFGGFRYYEDLDQKLAAERKAQVCYAKAAPHFQPAAERIEVPFKGSSLPGYLRVPHGEGPAPVVIIIPGNDARKEEFHNLEDGFLARGMATVSYDGPGQGEAWGRLQMRGDDETAVIAIMDFLESRPEIDAGRIGVYGWAMGGYFAPRAAAADDRVRACVSMPVRYSLLNWDTAAQQQTDAYQHIFGGVTFDEGREISSNFRLEGILPQVKCPYLIVHGMKGDTVGREEADQAAAEAGGPTKLVVYDEGDHLCINLRHESWPMMMDWFLEHLSA